MNLPPPEAKQCRALLNAFLAGEKLSVLTALDKYGVYALSQRVGELRNTYKWPIEDGWLKLPSGKRVKSYWIAS